MRPLVLAEYHARSLWNWRTLYYGRLIEPFVLYGLLVAGVSGLTGDVRWEGHSLDYAAFAFPGLLGFVALRAWAAAVVDVANDRKWGVYALTRISGGTVAQYAASVAGLHLAVALAQAVGLLVLRSLLVGEAPGWHELAAVAGIVGVLAFWLPLAVAFGMGINSYHQRDLVLSLALLPVAFTAPLLWSLTEAPAYLRVVSAFNPLRYQAELLRCFAVGVRPGTLTAAVSAVLPLMALVALAVLGRRAEWLSGEAG